MSTDLVPVEECPHIAVLDWLEPGQGEMHFACPQCWKHIVIRRSDHPHLTSSQVSGIIREAFGADYSRLIDLYLDESAYEA